MKVMLRLSHNIVQLEEGSRGVTVKDGDDKWVVRHYYLFVSF